jgi:stage V sporulation protein SpoVS
VRPALLAAPGHAHDLAVELARDLPDLLAERFVEVDRDVTVEEEPTAAATTRDIDLVDVARRRLLENGWDLVIWVTDLPVLVGRRPVVAHASVTDGVGLISVPALGAVALETRLRTAVPRLVERLLGERGGLGRTC